MTAEQLDRIEHYRQFLDKGFVNGNGIVDLYNEVFGASSTGRKQHYTSCGSCLRRLLKQLIQAAVEAKIEEADEPVTEEEKEPQLEVVIEEDIPDEPIGPESVSDGNNEVPTLEVTAEEPDSKEVGQPKEVEKKPEPKKGEKKK